MPRPGALVRAFDQARQIGDDEGAAELSAFASGAAVGVHHAEIWLQRGKRIVGDFRPRRGDHRNQRGLSRIGEAHQAHVSQQFQFQPQMAFFAGMPVFMFARRLVPGLRKVLIAAAPASPCAISTRWPGAARSAMVSPVFSSKASVPTGTCRIMSVAGMPGAIRAFAVSPAIGFEFAVVAVAQQRIVVGVGFQIDAAAVAAVAAGRTTARDEFLAAKRHAAVPAVPGFHQYFCFVDEQEEYISNLKTAARRRRRPPRNTKAVRHTPNRLGKIIGLSLRRQPARPARRETH